MTQLEKSSSKELAQLVLFLLPSVARTSPYQQVLIDCGDDFGTQPFHEYLSAKLAPFGVSVNAKAWAFDCGTKAERKRILKEDPDVVDQHIFRVHGEPICPLPKPPTEEGKS